MNKKDMDFLYALAHIECDRAEYYGDSAGLDTDTVSLAVDLVRDYYITMRAEERFKEIHS